MVPGSSAWCSAQDLVAWSAATTAAADPKDRKPAPAHRHGLSQGCDVPQRAEPAQRAGLGRSPSASGQPAALATDAQGGIRQRLQPGRGDRLAALLAHAVVAGLDLGQGPVDLDDGAPGLGGQDQVELPVDVGGAALAALLVELDIAGLVFQGQGVGFGLQLFGLPGVAGPLLEQEDALLGQELVLVEDPWPASERSSWRRSIWSPWPASARSLGFGTLTSTQLGLRLLLPGGGADRGDRFGGSPGASASSGIPSASGMIRPVTPPSEGPDPSTGPPLELQAVPSTNAAADHDTPDAPGALGGGLGVGDEVAHHVEVHRPDLDPLVAAGLPRHQGDARGGHTEHVGQQLGDSLVGPAALGGGCHLDLEGVAVAAHDHGAPGARLQVDPQHDVHLLRILVLPLDHIEQQVDGFFAHHGFPRLSVEGTLPPDRGKPDGNPGPAAYRGAMPEGAHPYPDVPTAPDLPGIEEEILASWAGAGTFEASVEQRPGGDNEYVFYDGPPFANGLPHYGHLLTGFVKDAVPRYQTMRGRRVERRFGWDCHGLPAETEAEKELGVSGRGPITEYGIDRFNDYCRTSVLRYTHEWERYVTRQARWVDFDNDYKTMDLSYMESVMWAFKQL